MAPRKRHKKGLLRIDAAYDALTQFGFSKHVIRNAIRTLLKEYGGDEGWVFIEENGYRLVIDAILEMQQGTADDDEEEDEKDNNVMMMEIEGRDVDDPPALEMGEPVGDAGEMSLYPTALETGGLLSLQSGFGELPLTLEGEDDREHEQPAVAGYAGQGRLPAMAGGPGRSGLQQPDSYLVTGPSSLQQPNEAPRRRRPPCYGWISESEDSEEET